MKHKKIIIGSLITIFLISLFFILFFSLLKIIIVNGNSMEPTYSNGQTLLMKRNFSTISFGDIVVFQLHGHTLIKRVVGLPGDTIEIANGYFYRNGSIVNNFVWKHLPDLNLALTVQKDHYFLLGDNVFNSFDSRIFGTILKQNIDGIII